MSRSDILKDILQIRAEIASCRRCPAMAPWRKFPAEAFGTVETGLMLVGEAPGYESWRRGRAFSNPRNLTVREALASLRHPRYRTLEDLFFLADAVRCQPPGRSPASRNRAPRTSERRNCAAFLYREIELLRPTVIVTLGRLAAEAVLGRPVRLTDEHGRWHDGPAGSRVVTLLHPSGQAKYALQKIGMTPEDYFASLRKLFAELIAEL